MPHFKCLACKTRLRSRESEADPIGDLCRVCGSLLGPVGDSVSPHVQAAGSRAPGTGEEAVRRRRRAPTTAAPPRVPRVLGAFDDARHRR
jgi:hypothetical protein